MRGLGKLAYGAYVTMTDMRIDSVCKKEVAINYG